MLIQNKQIAVIGGGPAGLTLARLLQLNGATVKVYERDFNKDARLIGSPLDMHEESGTAALRKAGLLAELKKHYRPGADKKTIADEDAKVVFTKKEAKPDEDFGNKNFRPEIDRYPLRRMLLESLQPETVEWDSHCVSMEKQNEGWLLHFKNGSFVYADIVIAADGANSKIRPYITDIKAFYTGFTMLEINICDPAKTIPQIYAMLDGGALLAFGNSQCILGGLKGAGDSNFYASFRADENWATDSGLNFSDKKQMLEWFKKEYSVWSRFWYELFENAEVPFIPRRIYCMPLDQAWEALPNLTMIGDAAHVMPPFAGEGANMGMLDALELSEHLTSDKYENLQQAVSSYESTMRQRAARAAKESLENGEIMHSADALEKMVAAMKKAENGNGQKIDQSENWIS